MSKELKRKECPICGKLYAARGIISHIRLKHHLRITEVVDSMTQVESIEDKAVNLSDNVLVEDVKLHTEESNSSRVESQTKLEVNRGRSNNLSNEIKALGMVRNAEEIILGTEVGLESTKNELLRSFRNAEADFFEFTNAEARHKYLETTLSFLPWCVFELSESRGLFTVKIAHSKVPRNYMPIWYPTELLFFQERLSA